MEEEPDAIRILRIIRDSWKLLVEGVTPGSVAQRAFAQRLDDADRLLYQFKRRYEEMKEKGEI
jgi:hypothetical protein